MRHDGSLLAGKFTMLSRRLSSPAACPRPTVDNVQTPFCGEYTSFWTKFRIPSRRRRYMNTFHPFRIEVVRSFAEANHLRDAWDRLAAGNFMLTWGWLSSWWSAFSSAKHGNATSQLILTIVRDQAGVIVGIAPFYRTRSLTGSALRFLGDGSACSDYVRILAEASVVESVNQRVARWIASGDYQSEAAAIDWVEIEGHTDRDRGWTAFWTVFQETGWARESQPLDGCWLIDLPGDWPSYYSRLATSRKRKIKKADKLLQAGDVTFEVLNRPGEIQAEWKSFVHLHQLRRYQLHQVGCFANTRFAEFLAAATHELAQYDQVQLCKLSAGQQPVAFQLLFRGPQTLSMYQSGFDPKFDSYEPGHLTNTLSLRYAIASGFARFDFLRGDEPYKAGWDAKRIPLFRTRCTAPKLSSRLKNSVWLAGRNLKRWGRDASTAEPGDWQAPRPANP